MALVRGNVQGAQGVDPTFNQLFDPLHGLPAVVTDASRVDRGFTDSPERTVTERIDDFNNPAPQSSWFVPNDTNGLSSYGHGGMPSHDSAMQKTAVSWWENSGPGVYFQPNWTITGSGRDISGYRTLEFRVDRADNPLNPPGPTDFSIALALNDGSLSNAVLLSSYADLRGPVGGNPGGLHLVLQTVRIPLVDFGLSPEDQARVRGLRFTFDQTSSGVLFFCNVRISTRSGFGATEPIQPDPAFAHGYDPRESSAVDKIVYNSVNAGNWMVLPNIETSREQLGLSRERLGLDDTVEIWLSSERAFPVRDELAVLSIGDQRFNLSRYAGPGTNTLLFTMTKAEYDQLPNGSSVSVEYGTGAAIRWEFGPLKK